MSLEGAACRGKPLEWFFPEHGQSAKKGKEVCKGCPCRSECLSEALQQPDKDDFGVWGGLSVRERDKVRAGRVACTECGVLHPRLASDGRIPKFCPDCRAARHAEAKARWQKQNATWIAREKVRIRAELRAEIEAERVAS